MKNYDGPLYAPWSAVVKEEDLTQWKKERKNKHHTCHMY